MPKTNIFDENAAISAELSAIKANQNLLNKVTSEADCNAFMTSPTTYADPWQIVFLENRDTIWTQGNEYGTDSTSINNILSYIDDIESWQTTYEPIINNTKSYTDALITFVGAKPVDERVQNETKPTETTIVDAIKNLVDYVDEKDSENDDELSDLTDRVSDLEQIGYTVASSSSYITVTKDTEKSTNGLTYYNITTDDIASATAVNTELGNLSERINDLTDSSRITVEADSSIDSDANARVNVISAPITGGGTAYTAYLVDVASKSRLDTVNTELGYVASYLEGLVTTYNGEDTTHSTVASYVSTAITQAIDEVNNDAAALESRVTDAEGDIDQLQSDVADLTVAYVVTAYQGTENKTGQSISLAHGGAFTLKQGGHDIATINLPLDMVVKSGTVITASAADVTTYASDNLVEGHHYIKLIVQNDEDSPLFVDTTDLVDIYTVDNSDTIAMNIDPNGNKITADINSTYTGYILNAINKVELATNETEGHVTLSYTKTDGTTGSSDVDLSTKFATKSQGDLADTALQGVTINGQSLTKDSNSYVLDGDNIYVSYSAEGGTATTGTINQAIAEIEDKLSHTSAAAVTSVNGTGAIFEGTGTGTYNGDVTITVNGSTVKSSSIPEGAYAIANNQTIDANLAALDNKVEGNKDAIAANAAEIQAIKNAINWTIIGS